MKLYKYQKTILEKAKPILDKFGLVYLAMAPRTGKTPIALSLIAHIHDSSKTPEDASLFVSKKRACPSIKKDITSMFGAKFGQIEVINYESLHKIPKKEWKTIILDEAHALGTYPKPTKVQKQVNALFVANPEAKAVLLSGTPQIESTSQMFHQMRITNKFWTEYKNFYAWFKVFGIPNQIKVRSRYVNVYNETKPDLVQDHIKEVFIPFTQAEADFEVSSTLRPIYLENKPLVQWIKHFTNTSVHEFEGFTVMADGAASVLSKSLQSCGGTIIDDQEKGQRLPELLNPDTKTNYIKSELNKYDKVCVFTNFIGERNFIIDRLGKEKCTTDMDAFKLDDTRYFVGSLTSFCEGFDLSRVNNLAVCIYSLSWSGRVVAQAIERQNNKLRKDPIDIYVPIIKDTPEVDLFKRVGIEKRNFNASFFRDIKR